MDRYIWTIRLCWLCYNFRKGVMKMTVAQLTMKETLCRRILDLPIEIVEQLSQCLDDLEAHEPNE
jgi:hypothetical protein